MSSIEHEKPEQASTKPFDGSIMLNLLIGLRTFALTILGLAFMSFLIGVALKDTIRRSMGDQNARLEKQVNQLRDQVVIQAKQNERSIEDREHLNQRQIEQDKQQARIEESLKRLEKVVVGK